VLQVRGNIAAQLGVAEILQFDHHFIPLHFIARSTARPWCKPVKIKHDGLTRAS
jgi:hypothetical protein